MHYSKIKKEDIVWAPLKGSQTLFLMSIAFETLFEGTRGPGKTEGLLMDYLQHVGTGLGQDWIGVLFRRTVPELFDVITKSKKWFPQIFPKAKFNKIEKTWTFPDGEKLLFRHLRVEDDYWLYHGHGYPWIGFEELTNWPDDGPYRKMMSCSRSGNPLVPIKFRATCNPYGIGHGWVKKRFRLPYSRGLMIKDSIDSEGELEPPRIAIHGNIKENTILLKSNPNYIANLRASARNQAELKAWLEGDWDIVAGGMFSDVFDSLFNVVTPFKIPRSWKINRSFDWGSSRPFSVGWWAESDGTSILTGRGEIIPTVRGDLYRIHEWYGNDPKQSNTGLKMSARDIAIGIRQREINLKNSGMVQGSIQPGPADTSIWVSEPGVQSIAKSMELEGIHWEHADKSPGSRKHGWEQLRVYLKATHNKLNKNGEYGRERPGMFIFNTCNSWLSILPTLARSRKDPDDLDTDAEDHIADETRYRVFSKNKALTQKGF